MIRTNTEIKLSNFFHCGAPAAIMASGIARGRVRTTTTTMATTGSRKMAAILQLIG